MTDLPVETKISTAYDLARLGALLLEAGESVTTVRSQMKSITTEHLDHLFEFSVLPTVVFVTDSRTGRMVAVNTSSDLSFRQAAQANRLPALIRLGRVQLSEVPHYAQRVRESIRASSTSRMLFGNAIVGGSFSTLFLSPVWAILAATVVGGLVGLVMRVLEKSPQGVALEPFVVSFISGTLMMTVADAIGQGDITPYAMVAPVVVLVPGATIAKALVESTSADIISGAARLLGASSSWPSWSRA